MAIVCPRCGDQNREAASFCNNCGMNLAEQTKSVAQPKPDFLPEQEHPQDLVSPAASPGYDGVRQEPVAAPQPDRAAGSIAAVCPATAEQKNSSVSVRPVSLPEEGQISGSPGQPKEHSQAFSPSGVGWDGKNRTPSKTPSPTPVAEAPSKSRRAKEKKKKNGEIPEITLQGEVCGVKWTNAISTTATTSAGGMSISSTTVTQYQEVCNFYVQTHDEIGNIQHGIPLEIIGRQIIRDGHQVQLKGNWQGTVFCATEIYNITTQTLIYTAPVKVKKNIGCISLIIAIVQGLVILIVILSVIVFVAAMLGL